MRRESSTVVALVGKPDDRVLAEIGRSPNVSVARAPEAGAGGPAAEAPPAPAWEPGALALREAARRRSTYADVLAAWRGKQFELPDYYLVIAPSAHAAIGTSA